MQQKRGKSNVRCHVQLVPTMDHSGTIITLRDDIECAANFFPRNKRGNIYVLTLVLFRAIIIQLESHIVHDRSECCLWSLRNPHCNVCRALVEKGGDKSPTASQVHE